MVKRHQNRVQKRFRAELEGKRLICLYIPDDYEPLADDLKEILRARLMEYLELGSEDAE